MSLCLQEIRVTDFFEKLCQFNFFLEKSKIKITYFIVQHQNLYLLC